MRFPIVLAVGLALVGWSGLAFADPQTDESGKGRRGGYERYESDQATFRQAGSPFGVYLCDQCSFKDLQQRCRVLIMTRERPPTTAAEPGEEDRRDFLKKCGKFAVITPPAVTLLLSTTLHSKAIAATSGTSSRPGWGFGDNNHGHTGPPGQNKNK
jgi:hypothetical protein